MPILDTSSTEELDKILEDFDNIILDVWAPWCGPCRMLSPMLEELGAELGDDVAIVKVNADVAPEIAKKYGVTALPTVITFSGGEKKDTFVGVQPVSKYKESIGL